MIRSLRSERMKLRRRSMLRGGGTIVGLAVLVTVLTFANEATLAEKGRHHHVSRPVAPRGTWGRR
jgi:hypothetical protein